MKSYVGTKIVLAKKMTLMEFNEKHRGPNNKVKPSGQGMIYGYHVQYEDGYNAWSPSRVFERCYREITDEEKGLIDG